MTLSQLIRCAPALLCLTAATQLSALSPFHGTVEVTQNNASNATSSISTSLSQGSSNGVTIDASRSNKGDYTLDFPPANDVADGVLLTSIAENGRDNSLAGDPAGTFYPTAAIDVSVDEYFIAISRDILSGGDAEFNINTSFAYFPYTDWLAGYARNSTNGGPITTLNASAGIELGNEFIDNLDGTYTLDLSGFSGTIDGVLLVSGGKNEDNYALSSNNGPVWTIYLHDNGENGVAYEQDPVAFVYLSSFSVGSKGLVALGRVRSGGSTFSDGGDFSVSKQGTGVWHLTIPGASPESGTLIVSAEGGDNFNVDNTVSAEYIGNATWAIQSRDLPNYNLQDGGSTTEPMFSFAFFSKRIYVSSTASGNNDGSSWGNAFTSMQDALQAAENGQEIWVATGSYYPDTGTDQTNNDRNATFALKSGVKVYGGFPATGNPTLADRDPAAYETILSGDIDQNDGAGNSGGNAYHVLTADGVNSEALLDGFTIKGGNANSDISGSNQAGGGLFCLNGAQLTLANCHFENNAARISGGAIYNLAASLNVTNSVFQNNSSEFGGAIHSRFAPGSLTITDCIFKENTGWSAGGAVAATETTSTTIINSVFEGNSAGTGGGAVWLATVATSPILTNCTFQGNSARFGGAIDNSQSMSTITHCSFQGNASLEGGGAVYNSFSTITLTNCIIWNNANDGDTDTAMASVANQDATASITYTHSLVQNIDLSATGTNNLDGTDPANNPRFVAEIDPLAAPIANGGDLRLKPSTPLLDRGSFVFGGPATDLGGNPRLSNVNVELGAYELKITYVDQNRTGGEGDGQSWFNAFTLLQEALKAAQPGDILFVAEGTYYPDRFVDAFDIFRDSDDRSATFALKSGVEIYGSFPPGGSFADRDPAAHETILSGDIDENDGPDFANNGGNAYNVLTADGTDTLARLDGFTITAGNADGVSFQKRTGAGLFVTNAAGPTISRCTFQGNSAAQNGGALSILSSSPTLNNSSFQGNRANFAGAVYNEFSSSTFNNCSFLGNSAESSGGAIINNGSSPIFNNCSFQGNHAVGFYGGAISNQGASFPIFSNCILWNNAADADKETQSASIENLSGSSPSYFYSLVQNIDLSATSTGNLDGTDPANNPRFVAEVDPLTAPIATGGDLRIFINSPALNVGDNNSNSTTTDLAGNPRIQVGTIDLGAFEGSVSDPALLWPTDFDLDSNPYGVEIALGTDPETADPAAEGNLTAPIVAANGDASVTFGYAGISSEGGTAPPGTFWILKRSTTLEPGSFSEAFSFGGSAPYIASGFEADLDAESITVIDKNPPAGGRAFYRFEAEFLGL